MLNILYRVRREAERGERGRKGCQERNTEKNTLLLGSGSLIIQEHVNLLKFPLRMTQ